MSRLTQRQRVKVNAALSLIHSQGYDAQAVVSWAKEYQRTGYDARRAYQQALNEFAAGQPALAVPIGKLTRLVDASDVPTVAKYDVALSAYIATGDDNALAEIAPIIARDSVALAIKNGELTAGDVSAARAEAATGFAMVDEAVTAASAPTSQPNHSRFVFGQSGQNPALKVRLEQAPSPQTSPYPAGGRIADGAAARMKVQGPPILPQGSRTLLEGHVIGDGGNAN